MALRLRNASSPVLARVRLVRFFLLHNIPYSSGGTHAAAIPFAGTDSYTAVSNND